METNHPSKSIWAIGLRSLKVGQWELFFECQFLLLFIFAFRYKLEIELEKVWSILMGCICQLKHFCTVVTHYFTTLLWRQFLGQRCKTPRTIWLGFHSCPIMPDRDMAILQEGAMKAFIDVVGRYECRFKYMHYGNMGCRVFKGWIKN